MKESYVEGLASCGGPESCVHAREGVGEALMLHHICAVERLEQAWLAVERDAAAGADGQPWQPYGQALEANLLDLSGGWRHFGPGLGGLPLSNTIRQRLGASRRQIELNRATTFPVGSRTGPVLSAKVPDSRTST